MCDIVVLNQVFNDKIYRFSGDNNVLLEHSLFSNIMFQTSYSDGISFGPSNGSFIANKLCISQYKSKGWLSSNIRYYDTSISLADSSILFYNHYGVTNHNYISNINISHCIIPQNNAISQNKITLNINYSTIHNNTATPYHEFISSQYGGTINFSKCKISNNEGYILINYYLSICELFDSIIVNNKVNSQKWFRITRCYYFGNSFDTVLQDHEPAEKFALPLSHYTTAICQGISNEDVAEDVRKVQCSCFPFVYRNIFNRLRR